MTPEQSTALRKPFPREVVGKLPKPYKADSPRGECRECGGYHGLPAVHLDYVGHSAVTDRLLTVDPAWSWEPFALDERGLPALDGRGNLWIRLTVGGVTRIGVGDGKSAKEVIGDAIRNAAMRFGVALDLWTKDELESEVIAKAAHLTEVAKAAVLEAAVDPEPTPARTAAPTNHAGDPLRTEQQSRKLWATATQKGMDGDSLKAWLSSVLDREVESSKSLTCREAAYAIDELDKLPPLAGVGA